MQPPEMDALDLPTLNESELWGDDNAVLWAWSGHIDDNCGT